MNSASEMFCNFEDPFLIILILRGLKFYKIIFKRNIIEAFFYVHVHKVKFSHCSVCLLK